MSQRMRSAGPSAAMVARATRVRPSRRSMLCRIAQGRACASGWGRAAVSPGTGAPCSKLQPVQRASRGPVPTGMSSMAQVKPVKESVRSPSEKAIVPSRRPHGPGATVAVQASPRTGSGVSRKSARPGAEGSGVSRKSARPGAVGSGVSRKSARPGADAPGARPAPPYTPTSPQRQRS